MGDNDRMIAPAIPARAIIGFAAAPTAVAQSALLRIAPSLCQRRDDDGHGSASQDGEGKIFCRYRLQTTPQYIMPPIDRIDNDNRATAGLGGKIGFGDRPALLCVDVCNAYWSPGSPLDISSDPRSAGAPAVIRELVEAARSGKVPVIWTRVEYTELDMSDAGVFFCKAPLLRVFQKGRETGLESWVSGLEPKAGELVISKRYPSAFFATDLNTRLQLKGVDTLVVCGVSTSGCVRASVLDAMCLGYRPMASFLATLSPETLLTVPQGRWRSMR